MDAAFEEPGESAGSSQSVEAMRGVRRGMAAPTDGGGPDVTAGIPEQ